MLEFNCCTYCYQASIFEDKHCPAELKMIVVMENRCPEFDPCTSINKTEHKNCHHCPAESLCAEQREEYLLKEDD